MNLEKRQNKIVKNKYLGYSLLRGAIDTGKTTTAIYRGLYLKNQYCMYEKDKILITSKGKRNLEKIKKIYDKAQNEEIQYRTLFYYIEDKVCFNTIDKIINKYFLKYVDANKINYNLISETEKVEIIEEGINFIEPKYKTLKYVNTKYKKFFLEEINWIKDCMYFNYEDYKNADRIGRKVEKGQGPQRVIKSSRMREAIFHVMTFYNNKLKEKKLIDYNNKINMALCEVLKERYKFSHIIVDETEIFTKSELKFVQALRKYTEHSSIFFVADKEENPQYNGWIISKRKLSDLNLGFDFKRFNFSKKFNVSSKVNIDNELNLKRLSYTAENKFHYIDIKHKRDYKFYKDMDNNKEISVKQEGYVDEYKERDLVSLPVFNDIAAGQPILMNPYVEDNFYIPKYWIKGMKDCFILKVKGDSMIGANIENGDYVVIKREQMAQNGDIVAVNLFGDATLKRLSINKSKILLMPENDKYDAIPIVEEGANIMGIAVGIIKGK
ncbi:S24 family peptidase [Clostridium niameyense]|uniref:S24 family peptidase n=1 Tax=Clostridium niameyense TaxID=1622073 RepID=UPI00067F6539|nr:S24 family peptidase [Clostridium niameyense]